MFGEWEGHMADAGAKALDVGQRAILTVIPGVEYHYNLLIPDDVPI